MPASPSPAFVRINYHSPFGFHTMQIPTLAWDSGNFATWAAGVVDDSTMIEDLVTLMLPFFPEGVIFDNWLIFSQPTPEDDPVPVAAGLFVLFEGTAALPGWTKAVQETITIRSTNFGVSKLVFLDAASGNSFEPITVPDGSMTALLNEIGDTSKGWSAQDNGRPATFIKLSKTLNEKLRRAYRMA